MKSKSDKKLVKTATSFKKKLIKLMDTAKSGKSVSRNQSYTNIGDIAELIKVCNFVKDGEIKKASNLVNSMPSFSTELLPSSLLNKLYIPANSSIDYE